jgi:hypothetical protein
MIGATKGDIEQTDAAENYDWAATVRIPPDDRAVEINVQSAPQHVIAHTDFTALAADDDLGENDYREAIFTVCLQDDRYAQEEWGGDDTVDCERTKIIWAGDEYRVDWVAFGTVVGIADGGTLQRSLGGFVHDDRDQLLEIAKVAHAFYSRERKVLQVETDNPTTDLELGDMLINLGLDDGGDTNHYHAAINSVITEIRVFNPRADAGAIPPPVRMRITTDAGELDPMQLLGPLPAAEKVGMKPAGDEDGDNVSSFETTWKQTPAGTWAPLAERRR